MSADPLQEANQSQSLAAHPHYSVFVTANAGSGKTKVLVDRIARLLLEGSKPAAFLCITYTKAAAAEMQRRLFERLGGWCVADDAKLGAELEKLGAPHADLGRARALFAQALETPGGLRIQTIHAFCERLLARFPIEAGVPPGFEIADEARAAALLGRARAEAALDVDAPRTAFRRFAAKLHGEGLEALLDRLALRRADFRRYAQKHDAPLFAEQALRDRHGAGESADDFAAAFISAADWPGLRQAAAALSSSTAKDQAVADRLGQIFAAMERGDSPRRVLDWCFDFAFSSSGELYKSFVTGKLTKAQPWIEPAVNRFAEACADARRRLNAIERAEDAVAALALALKLDEAYADAKGRAGALDFDDLIEHAQRLLQRSEAAPWVLYKLDGGLDHILIDEGQDTSPTQWELIEPLQTEFFAGAGVRERVRTMFAVGDPKQSIYAFQGADPARFLNEAQALSARAHAANMNFAGPELRTSFRSTQHVLDVVDAAMADKPLIASGPGRHDEIKHLAARRDEGGCVEVWPVTLRPKAADAQPWDAPIDVETGASAHAILAREIAQRVKAMIDAREAVWHDGKLRPMHAGDVLALVRTRGAMFRELIKAFKRAGLPVAGADRMVLRDELAVEDCLALMRVALDPADDLALACVLKGPWCNLTDDDADLFPLAYGRSRGETLMARLMASSDEKHAAARAFVTELAARRGAEPFAFLSWALETPHGGGDTGWRRVFARLGQEIRDPLEELLQRALKPAGHQAATLQRFLYAIEIDAGQVKRELEAETGAIRVMTVHGAKGLEAPLVILPDSTGNAEDAPDNGLLFDDEDGPFISFRSKDDDAVVATARAAHKERMLGEHWRLLYVAMTRARDRLIVCGPQFSNAKSGEAPESWRAAVESALQSLGAAPFKTPYGEGWRYGASLFAEEAEKRSAHAPLTLPAWAKAPAPGGKEVRIAAPSRIAHIDPALFSPRGEGQKRFRRGRLIHGLLQRLPDVQPEQRQKAAVAWLARQGVDGAGAEAFAREALGVIADARFGAVFGPASRAEAPIIGEAAGMSVRGIVDRLVVEAERVLVLDFKTDRPSPTDVAKAPQPYVLQLALYRNVLRQIFPGRTVGCALLWTETPHLMELPDFHLDEALRQLEAG
ncbi:MAG: double-strand break repair helicase AddA [Hyphomonadaceae bacterium]|nr:double-strand break repair helicase AddA [Hyphomonadaceae bacterium]